MFIGDAKTKICFQRGTTVEEMHNWRDNSYKSIALLNDT